MKNKKGLIGIFWAIFGFAVLIVLILFYPVYSVISNLSISIIEGIPGTIFLQTLILLIPPFIAVMIFLVIIGKISGRL